MKRLYFILLFLIISSVTLRAGTGFIEIGRIGKNVYLSVPDSLLGKDLLFGSRIVDISNPSAKVYSAGQMRTPPVLVRFTKSNGLLVMTKTDNYPEVDKNDPISDPLARNNTVGGICSFEIEPKSNPGTSVIDVTRFFSEEVTLVWPLPDNVKKGKLEQKQSGIVATKNYDDHINIRSHYVFLSQKEAFAITVQYFLLRLPEKTIKPRFNDDRIGYQPYKRKAYTSGKGITTSHYLTRWRIEPHRDSLVQFSKGVPVTPQKQIIVYIESFFPAEWIPYIKQGIEDWNKAFEKIGFRNVLVAKELADTTTIDPYDIKTNVVRYLPLEEANASGQIWTDPRSGEIISGEVLWWNDVVNLMKMWRFTQTAAADPAARAIEYDTAMMGEMVRYAIAHEIGHMLGMQHNMRGSYAYPVDSLKSPIFTSRYGTTASIMDYARNNHVADAGDFKRGVCMTPPHLGPFDYLSIEYGYKFFIEESSPLREYKCLDSIMSEKSKSPLYKFASFVAVPVSPDPSAQSESLGDDIVLSSAYGIKNTRTILANLLNWTIEAGGDRDLIKERYEALVKQYFRYITLSLSYIGGAYQNLLPEGDVSESYTAINAEKQKEAALFALKQLVESPYHIDIKSIRNVYGPVSEDIMKKQVDVLETMMGNFILPRIAVWQSQKADALTVSGYLDIIESIILRKPEHHDTYINNLQIAYVQIMKRLSSLNTKPEETATGTRVLIASAAYNQLARTKQFIRSKIEKTGENDHFRFLLSIIE